MSQVRLANCQIKYVLVPYLDEYTFITSWKTKFEFKILIFLSMFCNRHLVPNSWPAAPFFGHLPFSSHLKPYLPLPPGTSVHLCIHPSFPVYTLFTSPVCCHCLGLQCTQRPIQVLEAGSGLFGRTFLTYKCPEQPEAEGRHRFCMGHILLALRNPHLVEIGNGRRVRAEPSKAQGPRVWHLMPGSKGDRPLLG